MERIIMDVDTGLDDMVAIMLAAGSPELAIQGIIAAAGNQIIDKTLPNTLNVVQFLGKDIPVYAGSRGPLLRPQQTAGNIHGKDGLGDIPFPPRTKKAEPGYGVFFLIDTIMRHPGAITLVPTGPMTDIALAMRIRAGHHPRRQRDRLHGRFALWRQHHRMGRVQHLRRPGSGKDRPFQRSPDGDARTGRHACRFSSAPQRLESLKQIPGKTARQFGLGMDFYMATCMKVIRECPAMHDPCAIAYLLKPELFGGENHVLDVETTDEQKRGEIIDKGVGGMVKVITKVDADGFWPLLEQSLRNLG
jgi:ribosylpyrimidine nucleosidase